jgi:hypothetical protein
VDYREITRLRMNFVPQAATVNIKGKVIFKQKERESMQQDEKLKGTEIEKKKVTDRTSN